MIRYGNCLQIRAMCPDCSKPMDFYISSTVSTLGAEPETGNLACVICNNDDCINRGFMTTIEKKTGMVVYTDARYKYVDGTYRSVYPKYYEKTEF
jgi:hypothetical protein